MVARRIVKQRAFGASAPSGYNGETTFDYDTEQYVANYPYTYLASFMNPDFRATVVSAAVRDVNKAPGVLRQRLDRAVRSAGVQAPGYRPGKIPLNQVAKPLVTPRARNTDVSPFTSSEDIAYAVFTLWLDAKAELRQRVAAFLEGKGLPFSEELPPGGFAETLKTSEMEALAGEMGASTETDAAVYDETALMIVCLLGRAPLPDEAVEDEQAPAGEQPAASEEPSADAGQAAPGPDVAGVA
jgi:hypothetical protein